MTPDEVLDEIPSETTPSERRFLYELFRDHWAGRASVCEVGPFLGGSTRAIAMGMADNARRSAGSRLYTFDKFVAYHSSGELTRLLAPLIAAGKVAPAAVDAIARHGNFRPAFDCLHANQRYSHLVHADTAMLPDTPNPTVGIGARFLLPPDTRFDAVFVDGCKSWFATKQFMLTLAERLEPGAWVIFQDYLCYTCFWIPVFVGLLSDHFELGAYVDMTYAFRLRRPLSRDVIEERFPDTPASLGADRLSALVVDMLRAAAARDDENAVVCHYIHNAGALAYLGRRAEAKALLSELLDGRGLPARLRPVVQLALRSPTYEPDGAGGLRDVILT